MGLYLSNGNDLGRHSSHDVHRADVRPPPRGRPRGRHVPQDHQEGRRGSQDHVPRPVASPYHRHRQQG